MAVFSCRSVEPIRLNWLVRVKLELLVAILRHLMVVVLLHALNLL